MDFDTWADRQDVLAEMCALSPAQLAEHAHDRLMEMVMSYEFIVACVRARRALYGVEDRWPQSRQPRTGRG